MTNAIWEDMDGKTLTMIQLCLLDGVLQEVIIEKDHLWFINNAGILEHDQIIWWTSST